MTRYTVKNFREYVKTLYNIGIHLEIYFAHIKANDNNDKGVDDLLANTLKGKEIELSRDCDRVINNKDGSGELIQCHKITTTLFKKKIISYCKYRKLEFNPKQRGGNHKSGGVEYFTVADDHYTG